MPDSFSEMRKRNAMRVLELVRTHGELSRADLARMADLSKATVSSITAELIESDLLRETGSITTEKGRRPVGLVFNPIGKVAVGISVDDQKALTVVVTDMDGRVLKTVDAKLEGKLDSLAVKRVLDEVDFERTRLCAAGLAVPGPISEDAGDGYHRLAAELGAALRHEIALQSLVDMAALAEAHAGKLRPDRLVLFIRNSHRLRSTLLHANRLISTHTESGGEPGHAVAPWISEQCACGSTGCVNAHVGTSQLISRAANLGLHVRTVDELVTAANAADERAITVVRDAGTAVGFAVAGLVNVLAPVTVIVSGSLMGARDVYFRSVMDSASRFSIRRNFECSDILPSALGANSAATGAAIYALSNMQSPLTDSNGNGQQ